MQAIEIENAVKTYQIGEVETRALASHPLLVLADEPIANLDTENGTQVMEIMQRLNQETGTAFIFDTHDPRVVAYAKRVVKLLDGRINNNGNGIAQ